METTDLYNAEGLDDSLFEVNARPVEKIGKFRPKPSFRPKHGEKAKSISSVPPSNDGWDSTVIDKSQSAPVVSNSIENIQNMDDGLGSLSTYDRENQVHIVGSLRDDSMEVSDLNTPDILSEQVWKSVELLEKSQIELKIGSKCSIDITDFESNNASISLVNAVSEYPQLDLHSLPKETLDSHCPNFPAGRLSESLKVINSYEETACNNNINGMEAQCLAKNEDLHLMEGDDAVEYIDDPNGIVQDDEAGKLREVCKRTKKSKPSVVAEDMPNTDKNAKKSTISDVTGNDDDDVPTKKKRKLPRKSSALAKKSCKKDSEKPEGRTVKDPPNKRLPHGCRRVKRQVNKALLEIPDDELDRRQLAIRDLIRLASFKERNSNKEANALKNSFTSQSAENEEGTNDDDVERGEIQHEAPKLNYHSYLSRPLQIRWSKTDTESFYQAVRQFGTDFEMIHVLFPGRSRQQVKAKFKNEQRKHPLQIADALDHRSRDHSHFEKVIQHLQAVAKQNAKNEGDDQSIDSQNEEDQSTKSHGGVFDEEEGIDFNSKEEVQHADLAEITATVAAHGSAELSGLGPLQRVVALSSRVSIRCSAR